MMIRFLIALAFSFSVLAKGQNAPRSFNTVTEMLAANPNSAVTNAVVFGRNSKGDGGDGSFYYSASSSATTNKLTIFKPNNYSGRWIRVWDGVNANVEWAGAFPDDGIDDAPAIQATYDYLWSLHRGNVRLNRGGIYDIGSTLYARYRVNLIGQEGWKITELMSSSPSTDTYLLGGPAQLKMMDSMESNLIELYAPDGYLRQTEILEDGTTGEGRFADVSFQNIVFRGNINATGNGIWHGIVGRQKWCVNVSNCGFIYFKGNFIHLWDVNYGSFRDIWAKGLANQKPSLGMFVYSTADSTFDNITAGGFQGPAIWFNGSSTWWNLSSQLFLYNSFTTNTVFPASSVATTGVFTFPASIPISTGQQIELRTDGTLPTPYTDTQLYWAVRLSSTTYGIHTVYSQATNGVYLTNSAGSGTHYFTIGPASGLYMSGGARNNSFGTLRVDQHSGPGLYVRDADANIFAAVTSSRNTGSDNGETVYENDKAGVLVDKGADNNFVNATINDSTYGFATRGNASGNILNGVFHTVTVARTNGSSSVNNEYLKLPSNNAVAWGDSTTQTALALSGNASGVRILTLERPTVGKIGFGVASGTLTVYDESNARTINQLTYDGTTYRLKFGLDQASPSEARIVGNSGTGTDASAGDLVLQPGSGTGAGTTGGRIRIVLPIVGTTGTSLQSAGYRGGWEREGQFGFYSFASDPTIGLAAGQMWHNGTIGQFKGYSASKTYLFDTSLSNSATWDIPSLTTLANSSTTITVTGAAVGDLVVVSPAMPATGVVVSGDVTSADTVTIRAHNTTGGTIDPASATFRVRAIRQ